MCGGGVAGKYPPPVPVGRRLAGHVGEPEDPGGAVQPVIRSVYADERLAEIMQRRLAGLSEVLFGHHDPHRSPVLWPGQGMEASTLAADAPLRLLVDLDLGGQAAGRRVPPREPDAGRLADQTASSVASDEILRPQRLAVGQFDVDAGVVLRETRHVTCAID